MKIIFERFKIKMDKVALRNFAVNAKEKMENDIKRKLELIGITK